MSELLKTIKADFLQARKDRDASKAAFMSGLVGTIEQSAVTAAGRVELTDELVIATLKSYLKKNAELLGIENLSDNLVTVATYEKDIIEKYLPSQLTADDLRDIISKLGQNNLGMIMKHLKDNFNGQYDGKVASTVAKEFV